jgi:DNA-binding PadR family transcriptional regulator
MFGPHDFDPRRAGFGPFQIPLGPPGTSFGPPFGGGRGWHRRGRARRGNVRAALLALLAERPMHGYEMIQLLAERTNGMWQPSPGSVYPALQLLEDEGLITSQETEGKRLYSLTDQGRAEVERASAEQTPWEEFSEGIDPYHLRLRAEGGQLVMALIQVGHVGRDDQKARALGILADTRRRLYGILAEEDPAAPATDTAEAGEAAPGTEAGEAQA